MKTLWQKTTSNGLHVREVLHNEKNYVIADESLEGLEQRAIELAAMTDEQRAALTSVGG